LCSTALAGLSRQLKVVLIMNPYSVAQTTVSIPETGYRRYGMSIGAPTATSVTTRLSIWGGPSSPDENHLVGFATTATVIDQSLSSVTTAGLTM